MHSFGRYLLVFNQISGLVQVSPGPPGEGVMAGLAAELQAVQLYSDEARTAVALRRSMQDIEEQWAPTLTPS